MTIILHHFDVNFTCCEACALWHLIDNADEKDYLYSVELESGEVVTCNDCEADVVGQEEQEVDVNPAKVKYYQ